MTITRAFLFSSSWSVAARWRLPEIWLNIPQAAELAFHSARRYFQKVHLRAAACDFMARGSQELRTVRAEAAEARRVVLGSRFAPVAPLPPQHGSFSGLVPAPL
eukprot:CAMPEP_0182888708 /NCGR_PEP_ID=MMETSP0034_2-20130328/21605_1 /TAXON_ID=156128 /ORGANISM="Nephroselmis pyriformis, Strain CCMP717" /LENGTH=103 /DNA_ID=CAMNT_0025022157 /DNA_START=78 /DNA_END=386 /DNA_ORIENTATION=-